MDGKMKALITGASSGIGAEMAKQLAARGYELILVARRGDRLNSLARELSVPVTVIECDLEKETEVFSLYEKTKNMGVDVLINNAGFGLLGQFCETELSRELSMVDVNVRAVHILTKLFLGDFIKRDSGRILNVASSAGFLPGPLLATYYATKAYVLRLTQSIDTELRKSGSHVRISALCPGPVKTEFDRVAQVKKSLPGLRAEKVAAIAVSDMLKGKCIIVPGFSVKLGRIAAKLLPDRLLCAFSYRTQSKKLG